MREQYAQLRHGQLIYGRGSIEFLSALGKKRAAVVYDGRLLDESGKSELAATLAVGGAETLFAADIRNEPFFSDILQTLKEIRSYKPDLIVAFGGGSVIDAAKAAWLFYENPDLSLEDALKPYQIPACGRSILVAIPTTSGTGAETTCCSVFTNQENMEKRLILGHGITPAYAILDADFTDSMPPTIAAHTGMDALSHAMEAAVCKESSPMVVGIALAAAVDILENLPTSVNAKSAGAEKALAREICHYSATLAGIAINNASAGLVHALDQVGPYFNLPHGLVCGLLLPYATAFHSPHPIYAKLSRRLGYTGDETELCHKLAVHLQAFCEEIGIARSFGELGIEESAFMEKLDDFADAAVNSYSAAISPQKPTHEEACSLLCTAFHGKNL